MKYAIILLFLFQTPAAHDNLRGGIALGGYDPVSYFTGQEPEKGDKSITAQHAGAVYQFANEDNRSQFQGNPQQYVPAYGGWCAYAMGVSGDKVKVDPETFKIIDNRLYLFYNFWGNNTLKSWNEDENVLKADADKYWSGIVATK